MSWTFKLVTEPFQEFSTTPGLANRRTMKSTGFGFDETIEIDLGQDAPFIPELNVRGRDVITPRLVGPARMARPLRELMRLRIQVEAWTGVEWAKLHQILTTQRLVAFTPNWGPRTWWASTFGGLEEGGGFAEVGDSPSTQFTGRHANDIWPSPRSGPNALVTGVTALPKLVPGMIGNAIRLEGKRLNYANTVGGNGWTTVVSGIVEDAASEGESNSPHGPSTYVQLDASTSALAKWAATASRPSGNYVASAWVRGQGNIYLQVVTGVGTFQGTAVTLDRDNWQLIEVSWNQGSASIISAEVRNNSGAEQAMFHIGPPMVEDGLTPTSLQESGASPSTGDLLFINDEMVSGAGMTWVFWYKANPFTHSESSWFATWKDGGASRYIRINGTNYSAMVAGTIANATTLRVANEWTQLVVVFKSQGTAGVGPVVQMWENKVLRSTTTQTALTFPIGDAGIYIGGDKGFAANNEGLNHDLDSVRIDSHAWTQEDVENDYDMKKDVGVAALLAQTAGRLFRVAQVPKGYRGPFTDQVVGDLILEEASHIPTGLVS
jgi:hypothetical protein